MRKKLLILVAISILIPIVSASFGYENPSIPHIPSLSKQTNITVSGGNVTSVSSGDNCILIDPTMGAVVITFNTSCASAGAVSSVDSGDDYLLFDPTTGDVIGTLNETKLNGTILNIAQQFNDTTLILNVNTSLYNYIDLVANSSFNQSLTDGLYAKYQFGSNSFNGTGDFITSGGLNATTIKVGNGSATATIDFDGSTYDGQLVWDGANNRFSVSNGVIFNLAQRLMFRSTSSYIESPSSNILRIRGQTTTLFNIGGTDEATLTANTLTFDNGGTTNTSLGWAVDGVLNIIGTIVNISNNLIVNGNVTATQYCTNGVCGNVSDFLATGSAVQNNTFYEVNITSETEEDNTIPLNFNYNDSLASTIYHSVGSGLTIVVKEGFGLAIFNDTYLFGNLDASTVNVTSDWLFGKLNWSDIQNSPDFALSSDVNTLILANWTDLESRKLNITDQRYNDTALILTVNTTSNIMALSFYNKSEVDGLISSAGNSSFNQTLTDILYYSIDNPFGFINITSGQIFNETTLISAVNTSIWNYISTNEASWLSTYNSTYDTWSYNQTIPANEYTDSVNNTLTSWIISTFLTIASIGDQNVNSSNYWDNYDTVNSSQFIGSGGILGLNVTWLSSLLGGGTGYFLDIGGWITNTTSTGIDVNQGNFSGNLTTWKNLFVGSKTEAISSTGFVMNGNDAYFHDKVGINGVLYADSDIELRGAGSDIHQVNGLINVYSDGTFGASSGIIQMGNSGSGYYHMYTKSDGTFVLTDTSATSETQGDDLIIFGGKTMGTPIQVSGWANKFTVSGYLYGGGGDTAYTSTEGFYAECSGYMTAYGFSGDVSVTDGSSAWILSMLHDNTELDTVEIDTSSTGHVEGGKNYYPDDAIAFSKEEVLHFSLTESPGESQIDNFHAHMTIQYDGNCV